MVEPHKTKIDKLQDRLVVGELRLASGMCVGVRGLIFDGFNDGPCGRYVASWSGQDRLGQGQIKCTREGGGSEKYLHVRPVNPGLDGSNIHIEYVTNVPRSLDRQSQSQS